MSLIVPGYIQRDPDFYITDFSEYTAGTAPPDWTSRYGTGFSATVQTVAGSFSGQALRWTKTAAGRQGYSWDRVRNAADVEVLFRCRAIEAWGNNENFAYSYCRGAGSAGSETGYRGGIAGLSASPKWLGGMARYNAGTATVVGTNSNGSSPDYVVNTWVWSRFRVIGTSLQRRNWYSSSVEPSTWDDSATDSSVSVAGWTGLQQVDVNPNVEIDFFGVALRGKTVPLIKR